MEEGYSGRRRKKEGSEKERIEGTLLLYQLTFTVSAQIGFEKLQINVEIKRRKHLGFKILEKKNLFCDFPTTYLSVVINY